MKSNIAGIGLSLNGDRPITASLIIIFISMPCRTAVKCPVHVYGLPVEDGVTACSRALLLLPGLLWAAGHLNFNFRFRQCECYCLIHSRFLKVDTMSSQSPAQLSMRLPGRNPDFRFAGAVGK